MTALSNQPWRWFRTPPAQTRSVTARYLWRRSNKRSASEPGSKSPTPFDTEFAYKRAREVDEMQLRPHPYEFFLH